MKLPITESLTNVLVACFFAASTMRSSSAENVRKQTGSMPANPSKDRLAAGDIIDWASGFAWFG